MELGGAEAGGVEAGGVGATEDAEDVSTLAGVEAGGEVDPVSLPEGEGVDAALVFPESVPDPLGGELDDGGDRFPYPALEPLDPVLSLVDAIPAVGPGSSGATGLAVGTVGAALAARVSSVGVASALLLLLLGGERAPYPAAGGEGVVEGVLSAVGTLFSAADVGVPAASEELGTAAAADVGEDVPADDGVGVAFASGLVFPPPDALPPPLPVVVVVLPPLDPPFPPLRSFHCDITLSNASFNCAFTTAGSSHEQY